MPPSAEAIEMAAALLGTEYSKEAVANPGQRLFENKHFDFEVLGSMDLIPQDFPSMEGLKIPNEWDLMNIVVDGLVSFGVKKDDVAEAQAVRNMLQKQKGKKKNTCFPDWGVDPAKLRNLEYYYRYIIMYREAKIPLLFIGFDLDPESLDKCFWTKALGLKSSLQNPKSAKPQSPVKTL